MPDADTLNLGSLLAAVQEQIDAYRAADAAARKHDEVAAKERAKRATSKTALYELRDRAEGSAAAVGAVQAMLREAGISLPPSRRSA